MTVATSDYRVTYTGNGATVDFAYTFTVVDTADLTVTKLTTGTDTVITTYTEGTDYTVDNSYPDAGGTVSLLVAAASASYDVRITRTVDYTQDLDIMNEGGFYPATLQTQLDKQVMMIQQLEARIAALEA